MTNQVTNFIVELLKTTRAEIKLGDRKLYWNKFTKEWVVKERRPSRIDAPYLITVYEGNDEIEAVTALKYWDEIREIEI